VPVKIADFSHLPSHCRFVALMPQWDFLTSQHARQGYANFRLIMEAEATSLIEDAGNILARRRYAARPAEIHATLTVGADGRHSIIREKARSAGRIRRADRCMWMRLSKRKDDSATTLAASPRPDLRHSRSRRLLAMRLVIPKGGADALRAQGTGCVPRGHRARRARLCNRAAELQKWDRSNCSPSKSIACANGAGQDCVHRDAAHAMSPIGGVGINLAVQDARRGGEYSRTAFARDTPRLDELKRVQKRREFPTA